MSQAQIDLVKLANGDSKELRTLFLQYVNDFLTYQGVATYYGWSIEFTTDCIDKGRGLHEAYCAMDEQTKSLRRCLIRNGPQAIDSQSLKRCAAILIDCNLAFYNGAGLLQRKGSK